MAKTKEKKEGYIDNDYLRELIVKFNNMNYEDDGSWCQPYLSKLEKKYNSGKTDKDEYEAKKQFILKKIDKINTLREKYFSKMTAEERRAFNAEFEDVKKNLCDSFVKVIDGRIISFKLVASKSQDDIADIRQDALFTLFTYINRYDDERNTSAFAFVTQLITNAILLDLKDMKERSEREIAGLDFYNNMNTIDDPHGNDGLKDYME